MAENQNFKILMIHDKYYVFNLEPRKLAPTPIVAAGTHMYPQISDHGTPRHGTEVEAIQELHPEVHKFGHGHPHQNADISKGNQYHGPCLRAMEPATYGEQDTH